MNKVVARIALAAICSLAFAGCITHKSTVVRDVPRVNVSFENDDAARIFYDAFSKMSYTKTESTTEVDMGIIDDQRHVMTGPNAAFNQAVAECDANHDGMITAQEATIFADRVAREENSSQVGTQSMTH